MLGAAEREASGIQRLVNHIYCWQGLSDHHHHPQQKHQPTAMTATILAKETGATPSRRPYEPTTAMVVYYDVPIRPRVPLHVGQKIHIHSLTPANGEETQEQEQGGPPHYWAEETGIEGSISGIRAVEEETVELVVENENVASAAVRAVLTVQYIEGVTVRLGWWARMERAVRPWPLPATRSVPLEVDATVEWKEEPAREEDDIQLCIECGVPCATPEQRAWAWRRVTRGETTEAAGESPPPNGR